MVVGFLDWDCRLLFYNLFIPVFQSDCGVLCKCPGFIDSRCKGLRVYRFRGLSVRDLEGLGVRVKEF